MLALDHVEQHRLGLVGEPAVALDLRVEEPSVAEIGPRHELLEHLETSRAQEAAHLPQELLEIEVAGAALLEADHVGERQQLLHRGGRLLARGELGGQRSVDEAARVPQEQLRVGARVRCELRKEANGHVGAPLAQQLDRDVRNIGIPVAQQRHQLVRPRLSAVGRDVRGGALAVGGLQRLDQRTDVLGCHEHVARQLGRDLRPGALQVRLEVEQCQPVRRGLVGTIEGAVDLTADRLGQRVGHVESAQVLASQRALLVSVDAGLHAIDDFLLDRLLLGAQLESRGRSLADADGGILEELLFGLGPPARPGGLVHYLGHERLADLLERRFPTVRREEDVEDLGGIRRDQLIEFLAAEVLVDADVLRRQPFEDLRRVDDGHAMAALALEVDDERLLLGIELDDLAEAPAAAVVDVGVFGEGEVALQQVDLRAQVAAVGCEPRLLEEQVEVAVRFVLLAVDRGEQLAESFGALARLQRGACGLECAVDVVLFEERLRE